MYIHKFQVFIFFIVGIILIIGSIIGIIEKDIEFAIKMFVVGVILVITSIYMRKWFEKNRD